MNKNNPKRIYKQRGSSFLSWMVIVGVAVFILVTVAKIAPAYMEYATVKTMVDEIAADIAPSGQITTRSLRKRLGGYMNVNGLHTVKPEYFSVVRLPESKSSRALQVEYEVRKHWLANIDFTMNFHHVAEFKR